MEPGSSQGPRFEDFQRQKFFGSLDGVRAASVIAVVWHHTGGTSSAMSGWRPAGLGFLGVDMFFVLSGFIIVTLLLRERERKGSVSLKNFYVRRSLRIFPLYYGVILGLSLLYALLLPADAPTNQHWWGELPILLTYTANLFEVSTMMAIAWSLAVEEQFYLVWPSVERISRRFALVCLAAGILASQAVHFQVFGPSATAGLPSFFKETTFTPIFLGVAVAHAFHSERSFEVLRPFLGFKGADLLWLGALVGLLLLAPPDIRGWPRLGIQVVMAGLLASCVMRRDHLLAPVLSWRPLARIGVVSYGVYLLHVIAVDVVGQRMGVREEGPLLFFVLVLALTWVMAEASFRTYEQWFLSLKTRFYD